jgi:hypothetical protein
MHRSRYLVPLVLVVTTLLAALVAGCAADGDAPFKYTFEAGDSYTYDMTVGLSGTLTHPAASGPTTETIDATTLRMRFSWDVTDVTDGLATVTIRQESMEVERAGAALPMPDHGSREITVKIDEQGVIVAVEGMDEGLPPGLMGSVLPFDPAQLGIQTNVVMPEGGTAEPGDEWKAESVYPVPGMPGEQVMAATTAKLVSVEQKNGADLATIDFTTDVPIDVDLDLASILSGLGLESLMSFAQGDDFNLAMTMAGSESVSGTSIVNITDGIPQSTEARMALEMSIEITEAPAAVPLGQLAPLSIDLQADLALERVD